MHDFVFEVINTIISSNKKENRKCLHAKTRKLQSFKEMYPIFGDTGKTIWDLGGKEGANNPGL